MSAAVPTTLDDGTEVVPVGEPLELQGERWVTLCPADPADERLWEFSTTTGRLVQTMEAE